MMPAQANSSPKKQSLTDEKLIEKVAERVLELIRQQARTDNERRGQPGRKS